MTMPIAFFRAIAACLLALTVVSIAMSGCESTPPGVTIHPTPENALAEPVMVTGDSVPAGLPDPALARWLSARNRILNSVLVLRLGSEQPGPEQFSEVRAARLDGRGHLYILDDQTQEIRVFSAEGEHVTTFGGIGDGPNEMRSALDMSVSNDGRTVWALGLGWYKVFRQRETGLFEGSGLSDIPVPAGGSSCKLGEDRMVLSGALTTDPEHILHEVVMRDSAVDVVRSFGASYQSTSSLVRMMMSVIGRSLAIP